MSIFSRLKGIIMENEVMGFSSEKPVEPSELQDSSVASEEQGVVADPVMVADLSDGSRKYYYNGQEVVERLGIFDADKAEECRLADGTTAYVPMSVFE